MLDDSFAVNELGGQSLHAVANIWLVWLLYVLRGHGTTRPAVHHFPIGHSNTIVRLTVAATAAEAGSQSQMPAPVVTAEEVGSCAECGDEANGRVDPEDGEFYCMRCWAAYMDMGMFMRTSTWITQ